MKLDFLVIGAAKCGTTTLHDILSKHPDISVPEQKDFRFFDDSKVFSKGYSWYENFFKDSNNKIKGEVSATYLYDEKVIERIKPLIDHNFKIVLIVRNPANRALSEYLHQKRLLKLDCSFEDCLDPNFSGVYKTPKHPFDLVVKRGLYFETLQKWIQNFNKKNILILQTEQLKNEPEEFQRQLFNFLDVDMYNVDLTSNKNVAFQPKYQWLVKLVHHDNWIRKIVRQVISSYRLRQTIRDMLKKVNTSNKINVKLTESQKAELIDNFYKEDIARLNKTFKIKYNYLNK